MRQGNDILDSFERKSSMYKDFSKGREVHNCITISKRCSSAITSKDNGEFEWSDEYQVPFHHSSVKMDELPFRITNVVTDPQYHISHELQSYMAVTLEKLPRISCSQIVGYR